jgi:TatD DNase family protein
VSVALRWTDDHCHLGWQGDDPDPGTADAQVADARAAGVERIVTVGTDVERSAAAIATARAHPGSVWATVGLHPHEAKLGLDGLEDLLGEPEVVAVGECGLDYHYDHSPRDVQREVFAAQVALAHERDLALVIHTREAWADTFDVLVAEGVPERTVLHCFTGGPGEARRCLDLGAHLSFSGIVTFPSASDIREAAALCPLDRVLVETDSPYLAPVPHRGRPNRPALVPLVGAAVAAAQGVEVAAVAEATWANAERVYRLGSAAPGS